MEDLVMNDTMESEEYSVNEAAEKIIEYNNKLKARYKAEGLNNIFTFINNACKENNWQYYAVGPLLTYQDEGKDAYPKECNYNIRMMRDDYNAFRDYAEKEAKKQGLSHNVVYDQNDLVKNAVFVIFTRITEKNEEESIDMRVAVRVLPYDEVPADAEERRKQLEEAFLFNRVYLRESTYVRSLFKGKKTFQEKVSNKFIRTFKYTNTYFKKKKEDLYKIATRYDGKDTGYYGCLELKVSEKAERKEDIYPITEKAFLGTTLMVPNNVELYKLPEITEYIKKMRQLQTRALKSFDAFCEKNDITYFAMSNLLIECVQGRDNHPDRISNWKVGLLRKDYEKAKKLLADEKTSEGLVLKKYQDNFPLIPRLEVGFIRKEDDAPDIRGKNWQVLMEAFDYVPENLDEYSALKLQLDELRKERKELVEVEKGAVMPTSNHTTDANLLRIDQLAQKEKHETLKVGRLVTGFGDDVALTALFPVQKREFRGFQLSIPANEYLWYEKGDHEFAEQLVEKKTTLLKAFDQMCETEGVEYFAVTKLLVGIVVYHDIIPNSSNDQMMLGLVREEYEKLIQLLRTRGQEWNLTLTEFRDAEHKYPYATKYVSFTGEELSRVVLRLLPFDKLPESFYLRRHFRETMREYNRQYQEMTDFSLGEEEKYKELYTPEEFAAKKKEYAAMDAVAMAQHIDTFAQKYNKDDQAYSYERIAFSFTKIIDEDDLYPLRKERFRDMMVPCPRDYSPWQPVQDEALAHQVKCIQEEDKELIVEFDRVCTKLGIGYFICGGTMLGYMRHKGFIPWDDDVDVAMLRADYDRFLAEAGPELGEDFFLQTRESDPNIPYLFSKLRLNNTEYVTEYNKDRDFHKGLCLDIFPFDYVPNNLEQREKFVEEVIALSKEHNAIANGQLTEVPEPFPPRNEEEARLIEEEHQVIAEYWKHSLAESQKRYIDKATMYNAKAEQMKLKTVASFVPSYTYIDLNDLLPYQRGSFEGIEVSVPKRPDVFLEMQYGDYMELPPLHSRVAHRLVRWATRDDGADNEKKRNYN